jgi:hypothetical protein
MAPIIDLFTINVHFDVVDALGLVPYGPRHFRVQLDIFVQVVLVREALKVLAYVSSLLSTDTEHWIIQP